MAEYSKFLKACVWIDEQSKRTKFVMLLVVLAISYSIFEGIICRNVTTEAIEDK